MTMLRSPLRKRHAERYRPRPSRRSSAYSDARSLRFGPMIRDTAPSFQAVLIIPYNMVLSNMCAKKVGGIRSPRRPIAGVTQVVALALLV